MGICEGVGASAQEFEDYGVAEGARRTSWIVHLEGVTEGHRLMRYARLVLWEFQRDNKIINQEKPWPSSYSRMV